MIKAIIIDDEPQNAAMLKTDIANYCPTVQVVAECHSAIMDELFFEG